MNVERHKNQSHNKPP